jgi:hypothetical protein
VESGYVKLRFGECGVNKCLELRVNCSRHRRTAGAYSTQIRRAIPAQLTFLAKCRALSPFSRTLFHTTTVGKFRYVHPPFPLSPTPRSRSTWRQSPGLRMCARAAPNYPSPRSPPAPPTRPRQRPAHCRRAALCGAVTPYVALPPLTTTAAPQLHQPPSARQFTTVTPTAGPHCDLPVLDSSAACGTSVPRAPSTGQRDFDAALTFDACSVSQRQFSFASGVELTFVAPLDLPTSTGIYGSNQ